MAARKNTNMIIGGIGASVVALGLSLGAAGTASASTGDRDCKAEAEAAGYWIGTKSSLGGCNFHMQKTGFAAKGEVTASGGSGTKSSGVSDPGMVTATGTGTVDIRPNGTMGEWRESLRACVPDDVKAPTVWDQIDFASGTLGDPGNDHRYASSPSC